MRVYALHYLDILHNTYDIWMPIYAWSLCRCRYTRISTCASVLYLWPICSWLLLSISVKYWRNGIDPFPSYEFYCKRGSPEKDAMSTHKLLNTWSFVLCTAIGMQSSYTPLICSQLYEGRGKGPSAASLLFNRIFSIFFVVVSL